MKKNNSNDNTFVPPTIEIRKNVSLDTILSEQQITPITYQEIQAMTKDMDWEYTLEELLAALK